jgi:hypothetical protein
VRADAQFIPLVATTPYGFVEEFCRSYYIMVSVTA